MKRPICLSDLVPSQPGFGWEKELRERLDGGRTQKQALPLERTPKGQGKTMLRCITMNTPRHQGRCHHPLTSYLSTWPQHPAHYSYSFHSYGHCQKALRRIYIISKQLPSRPRERERGSDWITDLSLHCASGLCCLVPSRKGWDTALSSSLGQAVPSSLLPYHLACCLLLEDYPVSLADNTDHLCISHRTRGKRAAGKEHLI